MLRGSVRLSTNESPPAVSGLGARSVTALLTGVTVSMVSAVRGWKGGQMGSDPMRESGGRGAAQAGPLQHPREPRRIEAGAGMVQQAAVVPHQQVARCPFVAVDESLL